MTTSCVSYLRLSALIPVVLILYGCPYSSSYKMDDTPNIVVEDLLLGKWNGNLNNIEGKEIKISLQVEKINETEYSLCFAGDMKALKPYHITNNDSIKATAFLSAAGIRQILNIQVRGQYYPVEMIYKNNKLSLLPFSEHFTTKLIRSNIALRNAVEFHLRTMLRPLYDEPFCFLEMSRAE